MYRDIEGYLKENGSILIAPLGSSMKPMLQPDACQVVLVAPAEPPGKFDVVLYKSPGGTFLLHRIVGVRENGYDICGDNTYRLERGIPRDEILGVMEGFYRKDRYISAKSRGYRVYVRIWILLCPLRRVVRRLYQYWKRRDRDE